MIHRAMEGAAGRRAALAVGIVAGGAAAGFALAALAVTTARWALAAQPLVAAF